MSTIFFLIAITMIWYLPGLLVKSWKEEKADKKRKKKEQDREKAIERLYPKKK